jgi:hypothetical protein
VDAPMTAVEARFEQTIHDLLNDLAWNEGE